jgi:hypothetical protein
VIVAYQRTDEDCGVAALASYTGIPYEDVYIEAAKVDRLNRGKKGLHNYQVVAIARRLNVSLRATRTFDLDRHDGVLRVYFSGPRAATCPGGHFVAVRAGVIGCSGDLRARPWRPWLAENRASARTLLRGRLA